jgi:ADP-ribose pyrophosphatase YjhB (NUDIX family)
MTSALTHFLEQHNHPTEQTVDWGTDIRLRLRSALCEDLPPLTYVTSVRCIIFRGDEIMCMGNEEGHRHILPGGRRKPDETLMQTLHREIHEETGCVLDAPMLLGYIHFHHLKPKTAAYAYPYPDFVQLIYTAQATDHDPTSRIDDDDETQADFHPLDEVNAMTLSPDERLFLDTALKVQESAR